jgi:L-fucose mutarotase
MLSYKLTHPEILYYLASAGHGSRILLADSNYPVQTHRNPASELLFLNLAPNMFTVTQILAILLDGMPIERADVMKPDGATPTEVQSLFKQFESLLNPVSLSYVGRHDFYDAVRHENTGLVIATGETTPYGNLLLHMGVTKAE